MISVYHLEYIHDTKDRERLFVYRISLKLTFFFLNIPKMPMVHDFPRA